MSEDYSFLNGYGIWPLIITSVLMIATLIRKKQTSKINFYFRTNSLWIEVLAKTQLTRLHYVPSIFALHSALQLILFLILETAESIIGKVKYRREIFKLSDGGEMGLDWVIHP